MAMFNGRNVFLGYINGKDILLDKLIYRYDPSIISFGESLSQTSYDLITPESNKYYAISSEFEQISELYNVYNLSQEEYEELSTYDKNSLYIIKDNDEITNSYVGDTALEKLYLGENVIYESSSYPNWFNLTSAQIQQAIALLDSIGTNYDAYPYSGYFACSNKRGSYTDGTPYGLNIVKVKNLDTRVPVNIGIRKTANGSPWDGYQKYMVTANIRTEASCVYYDSNAQQFTITKRKENTLSGDLFGTGTDTTVVIFNSEDWFIYLGGDCTISDVT